MKATVAYSWREFFHSFDVKFCESLDQTTANHWLNAIVLDSKQDRDQFLQVTNDSKVMTRPIWRLMSELNMFKHCQNDGLKNSLWLQDRVINIPSSVPEGALKKWDN